MIHDQVVT